MLIGCARVTTLDQNLDLQRDALKKAGCMRVFTDQMPAGLDSPKLFHMPEKALSWWRRGWTGWAAVCPT